MHCYAVIWLLRDTSICILYCNIHNRKDANVITIKQNNVGLVGGGVEIRYKIEHKTPFNSARGGGGDAI
jgi:hypothetical protein